MNSPVFILFLGDHSLPCVLFCCCVLYLCPPHLAECFLTLVTPRCSVLGSSPGVTPFFQEFVCLA
jgi:hypothetical protein